MHKNREFKCHMYVDLTVYAICLLSSFSSSLHFDTLRPISIAAVHYKSSSADEIPERDVTYHLLRLLICRCI